MFVVRTPFRNYGQVLVPGMIVEPVDIKRFKNKLSERKIIEVTDATFAAWSKYFMDKFGVVLGTTESTAEPEQPDSAAAVVTKVASKVVKPVVAAVK